MPHSQTPSLGHRYLEKPERIETAQSPTGSLFTRPLLKNLEEQENPPRNWCPPNKPPPCLQEMLQLKNYGDPCQPLSEPCAGGGRLLLLLLSPPPPGQGGGRGTVLGALEGNAKSQIPEREPGPSLPGAVGAQDQPPPPQSLPQPRGGLILLVTTGEHDQTPRSPEVPGWGASPGLPRRCRRALSAPPPPGRAGDAASARLAPPNAPRPGEGARSALPAEAGNTAVPPPQIPEGMPDALPRPPAAAPKGGGPG